MKKMTAKEFQDQGFLQELNRNFLHPLGMALEVVVEEGDHSRPYDVPRFGQVWDFRDEPEGMLFTKADVGSKVFRQNALFVQQIALAKALERKALFGWVVQPIPVDSINSLPHTMEEDFQHFLAYSGYHAESAETISKLRKAFEAAWQPNKIPG